MVTGFGFCPNCGTALTAAGQKFCPTCGSGLPAMVAPAVVPAAEAEPQAQAALPAEPAPPAEPTAPVEPTVPVEPQTQAAPPPPWAQAAAPVTPAAPEFQAAPPPPWAQAAAPIGVPPAAPAYPTPPPIVSRRARSGISPVVAIVGVLLLAAVVAGAYMVTSGSSKTPTPGSSGMATLSGSVAPNGPTGQPGASSQAGNGGGLSGAASAFSDIKSFKFSMTLAGGSFGSMLSALGGTGSDNAPFTMTGTITLAPEKASDINMAGFHIIEIGGYDYLDMSGSGSFFKSAASGSSMADSFSPQTMFSSALDTSSASGWSKVGTETKNGVSADHYQASTSVLAEYGSSLGVTDATWSADVWIAKDGGYPVSMAIMATASDKSVAYEIQFDLSNVNDPANKITAPTNVTGL